MYQVLNKCNAPPHIGAHRSYIQARRVTAGGSKEACGDFNQAPCNGDACKCGLQVGSSGLCNKGSSGGCLDAAAVSTPIRASLSTTFAHLYITAHRSRTRIHQHSVSS